MKLIPVSTIAPVAGALLTRAAALEERLHAAGCFEQGHLVRLFQCPGALEELRALGFRAGSEWPDQALPWSALLARLWVSAELEANRNPDERLRWSPSRHRWGIDQLRLADVAGWLP